MVSRKPVAQSLAVNSQDGVNNNNTTTQTFPPYPTTPTTEEPHGALIAGQHTPAAAATEDAHHDLIDVSDNRPRTRSDSDASHGTWDTDIDDEEEEAKDTTLAPNTQDIPLPLRITPHRSNAQLNSQSQPQTTAAADDLPTSLRPGPPSGAPSASLSVTQVNQAEESTSNPWAVSGRSTPHPQPGGNVLESNNPYRQQNGFEPRNSQAAWGEAKPAVPTTAPPMPPIELPTVRTPPEELKSTVWADERPPTGTSNTTAGPPNIPITGAPVLPPVSADATAQAFPSTNPWSLGTEGSTETSSNPATDPDRNATTSGMQTAPTSVQHTQNVTAPITQNTAAERNEHYSIKQVNWYDAQKRGIRRSPILTQNANGPCPLLALVNALTLSTPYEVDTALVGTLQTRETISLSLLLDAVFDELMSGRRAGAGQSLPDVDELYAFLLALHTGMNVNPRFVGLHGSDMDYFEKTREMRLYSTFNIPLIHGWIPAQGTAEHAAFTRSAQTFEDAQNIQFAESELEDKQLQQALDPQESQLLADIRSIKTFLNAWPTQLTEHGLESISQSLAMGQVAILFRNDHFSTLYKEPTHGALMTLITDAGYSSHEEIVWESLVDVNGAASEMFSGDFRVVSHHPSASLNQNSSAGGNEGWQTVPIRNRPSAGNNSDVPPPLPGPRPVPDQIPSEQLSAREQEDHDLALALQLQEEEEDRQRQDEERRRREQRLSEQFLSSQNEGVRPEIPPRRSPSNQQSTIPRGGRRPLTGGRAPSGRPAVNRPSDNLADPEAPPSYEQAASDRIYRPAGATAADTQGSPLNTYDALMAQQSGGAPPSIASAGRRRSDQRYGQSSPTGGNGYAPMQLGRVSGAPGVRDAEERCTIM